VPLEGREVEVRPVVTTNSLAVVAQSARAGHGLAILPDWYVRDDIATGRLVRIGPPAPALPLSLAFTPERRTRRLDALIAAVEERLQARVLSGDANG
jgi:DNA-binding transcriptional LysR family regulator